MAFRVESKEELLKNLDETKKLILERERSLKERAAFAVKIRTILLKPSMCLQVNY